MDNTGDEFVVTSVPTDTEKTSSHPNTSNLSYSNSTPGTVSPSAISPSDTVRTGLSSF